MKFTSLSLSIATAVLLAAHTGASAHGGDHGTKMRKTMSTEQYAWGQEGDSKQATKTIIVDMTDAMHFAPGEIKVSQGDTVKFVVTNRGRLMHEMVIGTEQDLMKHAELMRQHPGMEHDEPYMAHVKGGSKDELTWTFNKPGTFLYGCLIPGHWEAGMKGTIVVTAQSPRPRLANANDIQARSIQ